MFYCVIVLLIYGFGFLLYTIHSINRQMNKRLYQGSYFNWIAIIAIIFHAFVIDLEIFLIIDSQKKNYGRKI